MGNGIAHVFAQTGWSVTLCDVKQALSNELVRQRLVHVVSSQEGIATGGQDFVEPATNREYAVPGSARFLRRPLFAPG